MDVRTYLYIKRLVIKAGFQSEIDWAENIGACESADDFGMEAIFVIANSGMQSKTARSIYERVKKQLTLKKPLGEVFNHAQKCASIQFIYDNRRELFSKYRRLESLEEKHAFLRTLPHIGPVIVFHLMKNLGENLCKPDRHLVRIANFYKTTPDDLCGTLSEATGDRITTVDTSLWRACSERIITFKDDRPIIPQPI